MRSRKTGKKNTSSSRGNRQEASKRSRTRNTRKTGRDIAREISSRDRYGSNYEQYNSPAPKRSSDESLKRYELALTNNKNNKRMSKYEKIHKANMYTRKQNHHVSLTFFLFLFLLSYIAYHLLTYASAQDYTSTVVEEGKLVNSQTFNAFIIRDEDVYLADRAGDLRMIAKQGDRVRQGMEIAGIIADSEDVKLLEEKLNAASEDLGIDADVDDEVIYSIRKSFKNFTINNNFNDLSYAKVYNENLKRELAGLRDKYLVGNSAYSDEYLRLKQAYNEKIDFIRAKRSGVLSFAMDGKEDSRLENIDFSYISKLPDTLYVEYKGDVESNEPIFKIINDYLWYTVMEVDDVCEKEIEDSNYVEVLLGKEKIKQYARVYEVINKGEKTYLILEFDRMLNAFLDRRVMEVEIVHSDYDGLKIPKKSVATKEFVKVKNDYFQYINHENVVIIDKSEEELRRVYPISVFREEEDYVWLPSDEFLKEGVKLYLGDGKERVNKSFEISETKEFDGVFVINKGYADFKFIDAIYEEDGFLVVRDNTSFGLRIYDRIITDSSSADENAIIVR